MAKPSTEQPRIPGIAWGTTIGTKPTTTPKPLTCVCCAGIGVWTDPATGLTTTCLCQATRQAIR